MRERDDQKYRYHAYAAAARELARWAHAGKKLPASAVRIPDHPTVQMVEDGAFVEATIWVPRSAIASKEDQ